MKWVVGATMVKLAQANKTTRYTYIMMVVRVAIFKLHAGGLRKMPLIYRGMVPSQSGPLWLLSGGHHGLGQYLRNGGNKILPRN